MLSQLAWMDEEYLDQDFDVARLSLKGSDYTELDKKDLRAKPLELLARVLPEYRRAQDAGQTSKSPRLRSIIRSCRCFADTDIAREANPGTPLPQLTLPSSRKTLASELVRARRYHEHFVGRPPVGLWPSGRLGFRPGPILGRGARLPLVRHR